MVVVEFEDLIKRIQEEIGTAMSIPYIYMELHKSLEEEKEARIRGKALSIICGHPEWENTCIGCGDVEISIFEKTCKSCFCKAIVG